MGRGLLLERQGRRGIVLTPEGTFRQVRLDRACEVGQEIDLSDRERAPVTRWVAAAAVLAVAVLLPFLKPLFLPLPAVALVSVDINPSVELWVTAGARVRTARALNADGERLLKTVRYRGRPVEGVVADLTAGAYRLGYLRAGDREGTVLITIAPMDRTSVPPERVEDLHEAVYRAAESAVRTNRGTARVQTLQATEAERAAAEKLGVSPGRYLLYEELQAERPGTDLQPEAIQRLRPAEVSKVLGAGTVADLLERIRQRQKEKGLFPGRSPEDPSADRRTPDRKGTDPGQDAQGQNLPGSGQSRTDPRLPFVPELERLLAPLREFGRVLPEREHSGPEKGRKPEEKELEQDNEKGNGKGRAVPPLPDRSGELRPPERHQADEARHLPEERAASARPGESPSTKRDAGEEGWPPAPRRQVPGERGDPVKPVRSGGRNGQERGGRNEDVRAERRDRGGQDRESADLVRRESEPGDLLQRVGSLFGDLLCSSSCDQRR